MLLREIGCFPETHPLAPQKIIILKDFIMKHLCYTSTMKKIALVFLMTMIIFAGGIALAYVGLLVARGLIEGPGGSLQDNDSGKILFVYSVPVVALLIYLGLKFLKRKTKLFRYGATLLFISAGLNGLVLAGSILMLSMSGSGLSASAEPCNQINDQIYPTINATVPIATDLGTGTGFAITRDGLIITAEHVISGAKEVYLNYADGKVPVTVIDRAPEYDLALLKANTEFVYPLRLTGKFNVGDEVLAAGYPGNAYYAGQASISSGIISRLLSTNDLRMTDKNTPEGLDYIQTDAPINSGNSGGALVNKCGVIGVIVSKSDIYGLQEFGTTSEAGISYAVSAKTIAERFKLELR